MVEASQYLTTTTTTPPPPKNKIKEKKLVNEELYSKLGWGPHTLEQSLEIDWELIIRYMPFMSYLEFSVNDFISICTMSAFVALLV
jgi:hypothetical protein